MTVILVLLTYLSFSLSHLENNKIEIISLDGNLHLSKEQYFEYANLIDRSNYSNLTTQYIKDRIRKHPYVERADVKYDGNGKISIKVSEKIFESILLYGDSQYLLTEDLQVLPMLPKTKKIDYPIISNPAVENLKMLSFMKKNNDLVIASKIISTVKLINPELYDGFSTIDLQNGGDIILYFSFFDYPVIIGRGSEIRRTIYFNNLWTYLKGKEINNFMDYVDMRYGGHVYLGIQETSKEGNNQS